MLTKLSKRLECFILCVLCMVWLPAHAQWQLSLAKGEHAGYRSENERIRIHVPPEMPVEELQRLALEIDNIDVTAMVGRDGEYAVYQPVQPLASGTHALRVIEYANDGSIIELGYWTFEVRQSGLFSQYAVAADTQVIASYRVADHNLTHPEPDRLQGQGSSNVGFRAANGDWYTEGQFNLIYDSLSENRNFDNGEFLFAAGNQYADVRVGHQSVGSSSLVMDNFRRRGVSMEGRIPVINTRVSGFSLSSEDVIGFQRGLAIGDSKRRVDGVTFDSSPLTDNPKALFLSGTWLDGEGRDSSGLVAGVSASEPGGSKGTAWSLSADSLLFSDRLRLRGEYAHSHYDFNTVDNLAADGDDAYDFLATFSDKTTSGLNWNIGAETRQVGTFFKSLANQALPSDRRLISAFGGGQWTTVGLQLSFERQTDNVNDIAQLPRIRTYLGNVVLNWAPQITVADSWMGAPSFSVMYSRQNQDQTSTPSGSIQAPIDNDLNSWQASAMFSYPSGNWGATFINTQFRDHSRQQDDTDTLGVNFDSYVTFFHQRLSLSPSIQYNRVDDKIIHEDSTVVTYGLQTAFVALPEVIDGSVTFNLNQNRSSNNAIDNDTLTINLALNWHVLEAKRNRIGIDLGFTGMYNDINDQVAANNAIDTYQLFLTLSAVLPTRIGQAQ